MKQISVEKRNSIIQKLQIGASSRKISHQLRISHTTVNNIRKKYLPEQQKSRGGCPKKLSLNDERKIVRSITSGKADTAVELQKQLFRDTGNTVHPETIRNVLKQQGLKSLVKPKKPLLTPKHKNQRLEFARRHQHWTIDDWKRVVWSDETKINRYGSDGRKWSWKSPNALLKEHHIDPTLKYGGGSVMIWGCMTTEGVGYMCRIDDRMDSQLYTEILDDCLFQSVEYYDIEKSSFIFQHDNDPKHTSKLTEKWLKDNGVQA